MLDSFKKIDNETTLIDFEKKIQDAKYRTDLLKAIVECVGKHHRDLSYRNIALQIESKLIDSNLWTNTAWSGGRPIGVPSAEGEPTNQDQPPKKKFAFVEHIVFRSFFSDAIKEICGSAIPDNEMSTFVQSRTRNSKYVRSSNRQVTARKRAVRQKTESGQNGNDNVSHEDPALADLQ